MSLGHGSSIVRDNLVFYYDTANTQKSWKGKPATNLVASPYSLLTGFTKAAGVTVTDNVARNIDGTLNVGLITGTGWLAYVGASTTNGQQYTTSWIIKKDSASVTIFFGWGGAHQGNLTTFTFNLQTGAFTGVTQAAGEIYGVRSIGDFWVVYYSSTLSAGNAYYPQITIGTGVNVYFGGIQIEAGITASPLVTGTRTNTQALLDLTSINTVTANSLTYASNNTFSFNGSNNSITIDKTLDYIPALSNFTLETWLRVPAFPTAAANNAYGQTDRAGVLFGATYYCGAALYWRGNSTGTSLDVFAFIRGKDLYRETSSKSISLNTWTHLVMVNNYTASKIQFYVDGLLYHETTGATQEYDSSLTPTAGNIGLCKAQIDGGGTRNYSNLNCEVPIARIYKNKALTAAEVKQNFEALRGRYGI